MIQLEWKKLNDIWLLSLYIDITLVNIEDGIGSSSSLAESINLVSFCEWNCRANYLLITLRAILSVIERHGEHLQCEMFWTSRVNWRNFSKPAEI